MFEVKGPVYDSHSLTVEKAYFMNTSMQLALQK